jgi:hypothetical protein
LADPTLSRPAKICETARPAWLSGTYDVLRIPTDVRARPPGKASSVPRRPNRRPNDTTPTYARPPSSSGVVPAMVTVQSRHRRSAGRVERADRRLPPRHRPCPSGQAFFPGHTRLET